MSKAQADGATGTMKTTNPIFTGIPTTIFEVMSRLADTHGAINLGQGFPDVDGPEDIRRMAADPERRPPTYQRGA